MNIRNETLTAMAVAIRAAMKASLDDIDLAEAALKAFCDYASMSDWDELEAQKELP